MTMYLIEKVFAKGCFYAWACRTDCWTRYSVYAERYASLDKAIKKAKELAEKGISCSVITDRKEIVHTCFTEDERFSCDDYIDD